MCPGAPRLGGSAAENPQESVMTPYGDRRSVTRFEIIGTLWGQLELVEPVRIINVSMTGALIDSPVPAALDSTQPIHFTIDGERMVVDARVRHVRRLASEPGSEPGPSRFMIGVEFIAPPMALVQ